jgi:hypothetical protein
MPIADPSCVPLRTPPFNRHVGFNCEGYDEGRSSMFQSSLWPSMFGALSAIHILGRGWEVRVVRWRGKGKGERRVWVRYGPLL